MPSTTQKSGHARCLEPAGLIVGWVDGKIAGRAGLIPHTAVSAGHDAEEVMAGRKIVIEPFCHRCVPACQNLEVNETLSFRWDDGNPRVLWDGGANSSRTRISHRCYGSACLRLSTQGTGADRVFGIKSKVKIRFRSICSPPNRFTAEKRRAFFEAAPHCMIRQRCTAALLRQHHRAPYHSPYRSRILLAKSRGEVPGEARTVPLICLLMARCG